MIAKIKPIKDKFIEEIYESSMEDLNNFFDLNWKINRPNIILVSDRKTINLIKNEKTEDWCVGWCSGRDVYVLDRKNYGKESCHKYSNKTYSASLKHELVHAFTNIITGGNFSAMWVIEGIAIHLSGQNNLRKKPEKLKKFLEFYDKYGKEIYSESGFAVEFLIKKYGKEKFIELLTSLKKIESEKEFQERFKEIYKFELNYENFN